MDSVEFEQLSKKRDKRNLKDLKMFQGIFRAVVHLILLLTLCQYAAASDSEIVEAETYPSLSATTDMPELPTPKWSANDTVLVKPYNILEASCPQGYVLANKHCHKRVRGAPTVE